METILLVAAERREVAGLLRRLPGAEKLPWPVDFARAARHNGRRLLLVANGSGPKLAAQAVEVACRKDAVSVVVSTGFCGAVESRPGSGDDRGGRRGGLPRNPAPVPGGQAGVHKAARLRYYRFD